MSIVDQIRSYSGNDGADWLLEMTADHSIYPEDVANVLIENDHMPEDGFDEVVEFVEHEREVEKELGIDGKEEA